MLATTAAAAGRLSSRRCSTTAAAAASSPAAAADTAAAAAAGAARMSAWQIDSYAGTDALKHSRDVRIPVLRCSKEVLVQVHASSVNPLDVWMTRGYGFSLFNLLRGATTPDSLLGGDPSSQQEFPLTLGRDFSGTVIDKGRDVTHLQIGDRVWGATFPSSRAGTHSNYIAVPSYLGMGLKPASLSHTESAAIPYAGLTAWSALSVSAGMYSQRERAGRRVCVLGASGGVGHLAVQMLKKWKCEVTAVCGADFHDRITAMGASAALDYNDDDYLKLLTEAKGPGFDVILDCSGHDGGCGDAGMMSMLKPWSNAKYVTLTGPLLRNMNTKGVAFGTLATLSSLISANVKSYRDRGNSFRYAYFAPIPGGLEELREMADSGELKPVIESIYDFSEVDKAFERVDKGGARGKSVIQIISQED